METLFYLFVGHALTDFALQSETMAKGKNRNRKPDYIPVGQKLTPCWPYWLSAHALINGGMVALVTGVWWLGVAETGIHWISDFFKCENTHGVHSDQSIHLISKVAWWGLI